MKFRSSLSFLGVLAAVAPFSASAFVTTFPAGTYAPLGSEIAGKDGWTISDPGADGPGSGYPLSYSNYLPDRITLVNSVAAELGGNYDPPLAASPTSVFLSHDAAGELQNTSFTLDFAIRGSGEAFPGRDGFGFALRDSSNGNLLSVLLVPEAGGTGDAYRVAYSVGGGAPVNAQDGSGNPMYVHAAGLYTMTLAFTPGGANPTFSGTITGTNTQTFTGTATGLGTAAVDRFGALWNVSNPVAGDNGIIFDNLSVVPESSTALLAGLASFGLLRRRRHH